MRINDTLHLLDEKFFIGLNIDVDKLIQNNTSKYNIKHIKSYLQSISLLYKIDATNSNIYSDEEGIDSEIEIFFVTFKEKPTKYDIGAVIRAIQMPVKYQSVFICAIPHKDEKEIGFTYNLEIPEIHRGVRNDNTVVDSINYTENVSFEALRSSFEHLEFFITKHNSINEVLSELAETSQFLSMFRISTLDDEQSEYLDNLCSDEETETTKNFIEELLDEDEILYLRDKLAKDNAEIEEEFTDYEGYRILVPDYEQKYGSEIIEYITEKYKSGSIYDYTDLTIEMIGILEHLLGLFDDNIILDILNSFL